MRSRSTGVSARRSTMWPTPCSRPPSRCPTPTETPSSERRARRARLRPPGDVGRGARRCRGHPARRCPGGAGRAGRCRPRAGGARVAVVFPALTRPMPNRTVLPPLLAALEGAGVTDDRITLLCATGTHRQATPGEMAELVGPAIASRFAIVDHDATSDQHVRVGDVDGVPVLLQREYVEADVRIV